VIINVEVVELFQLTIFQKEVKFWWNELFRMKALELCDVSCERKEPLFRNEEVSVVVSQFYISVYLHTILLVFLHGEVSCLHFE